MSTQGGDEYLQEWPVIDAGSPGQADQHDIIDGRPPEGGLDVPPLVYENLDPDAPENQVNVTAFSKYWYSFLPSFMKEADEIQNPLDGGWPMLRYMDAAGHIADGVRATVQDMYQGVWTDPATVPDRAVPWLASMLGVPQSQKNVPLPQLREVLTDMVANGRAPTGTRTEIATAAKQFLTGERQALVVPQVSLARNLNNEDLALAAAMGYAGRVVRVHVSRTPPATAGSVDDIWVNPITDTVWTSDGAVWTEYVATDVTAEREAVEAARERETFLRAHTIVLIVRPDDVPGGDLPALAANMRNVGAIPAGHAVVIILAQPTWDNWEAAVAEAGGTWADYERVTKVWSDDESLGLGNIG